MHRWIVLVTCVCACTRPADREKPAAKDDVAKDAVAKDDVAKDAVAKDAVARDVTADGAALDDAGVAPDAPVPTIAATAGTAGTAALGTGDSKIAQVEMAGRTACARRADGAIRCWGSATARELGSVVPYTIEGVPEAAAMHLAHGVLAVATRSGDVAIGPIGVPGQPKLELVSVGEAIDVRVDSPRRAWALTRSGEVHRIEGTSAEKKLINVIALSSREVDSLDALHRDGTVTTVADGKAIPIKGLTDAEALFGSHCAHRKSGGVACWNKNGKTVAWKGPLNVVDRRSAVGVTCTLAGSGVSCVGRNDAGQLGTGTGPGEDIGPKDVAKIVPLPGRPVAIAGGDRAWCAVLDGGALACWGANDGGQLGDGTLIDRPTPVVIAGASSATAPVAPKPGEEPVAEADVEMGWHDLPKGCAKPTTIPRPGGDLAVVSAYAILGARDAELWFADFKILAGGYREGHVVARGKQMAVVYELEGKIARGRYRGKKGTVALGTLGAPPPSPADVLVEKVEDGWICGTILDPEDAKKRAPFAAKIAKPRYE